MSTTFHALCRKVLVRKDLMNGLAVFVDSFCNSVLLDDIVYYMLVMLLLCRYLQGEEIMIFTNEK